MNTRLNHIQNLPELVSGFIKTYHRSTGISLTLIPGKPPESVISSTHQQDHPICSLIARSKAGCERCHQFMMKLQSRIQSNPEPCQVQGPCGLTYLMTPVMIEDQHVATLLGGRVFTERPADRDVRRLAHLLRNSGLKVDIHRVKEACSRVCVVSGARLVAAREFFAFCSQLFAAEFNRCTIANLNAESPRVRAAKECIQTHSAETLRVLDVARQVHLGQRHFARLFKRETGFTFVEFLSLVRVANAKELLPDPNLCLKEVASRTGFQYVQDFNRVFKNHTGISPGEYRASLFGRKHFLGRSSPVL